MKKLLSMCFLMAVCVAVAQVPPFIRNSLNTNSEAAARNVVTNIAIESGGGLSGPTVIAFGGDSLICGAAPATSGAGLNHQWTNQFLTSRGWVYLTNAALTGTGSDFSTAAYSNSLHSLFGNYGNGTPTNLVLVSDFGVLNDYLSNVTNVTIKIVSNTLVYAKADGVKVVPCTIPNSANFTGVQLANAMTYNKWLLSNPDLYWKVYDMNAIYGDAPSTMGDGGHLNTNANRTAAIILDCLFQGVPLQPPSIEGGQITPSKLRVGAFSVAANGYVSVGGAGLTSGFDSALALSLLGGQYLAFPGYGYVFPFVGGVEIRDQTFVGLGVIKTGGLDSTGRVAMTVGSSTNKVRVGGTLTDFISDAANVTTAETDLYSFMVQTNTLTVDKDKITFEAAGSFTGGTPTKQLKIYLSGTAVFDSGALGISSASDWHLRGFLIRSNATVVRGSVTLNTSFASLSAYSQQTDVSGLTLTTTNIFRITGTSAGVGAASGDIVANQGTIDWKPAGPQ